MRHDALLLRRFRKARLLSRDPFGENGIYSRFNHADRGLIQRSRWILREKSVNPVGINRSLASTQGSIKTLSKRVH